MARVDKMHEFFNIADGIIEDMAKGNSERIHMLNTFFIRILSVLDGLEMGNNPAWSGLRLVDPRDLPESVEEINDGFLHDAWSERG